MILEKAVKAARVREAARKARRPWPGRRIKLDGRAPGGQAFQLHRPQSQGKRAVSSWRAIPQAVPPSRAGTGGSRPSCLLRGKPLNAEKKRLDQVLANEEFRSIITALGTGIGEDFDITHLQYDRVIILSDADQDGAHIRAILLTFFFRYMKELVTEGHVYIGHAASVQGSTRAARRSTAMTTRSCTRP